MALILSIQVELLRNNTTNINNRELNIIVLTGELNHSINYSRGITHNWNYTYSYKASRQLLENSIIGIFIISSPSFASLFFLIILLISFILKLIFFPLKKQ